MSVCNECGDTGTKLEWYKSGEVFSDKWKCSKCDIETLAKKQNEEVKKVKLTEAEKHSIQFSQEDEVRESLFETVEAILTARVEAEVKRIEERLSVENIFNFFIVYKIDIEIIYALAEKIHGRIRGK